MDVAPTSIDGVLVLTPARHRDDRGFLSEVFNGRTLSEIGLKSVYAQENHIYSPHPGTVRGLHLQMPPLATVKLIRVITGSVFDVAVDLRKGSPTFGQHFSHVLSEDNWQQVYMAEGIAHGLCTLEPHTRISYLSSQNWSPEVDAGVRWDDPELAISWPINPATVVVSDKDRNLPDFSSFDSPFTYARR